MAENNDAAGQEGGKQARILVVDDSKIVRVTATRTLSTKFDVVLAEDGEEAWQKLCEDHTIQVVFTDLGMPKLDGYGLIQRIRQSENEAIRNQPIIVITGASEEEGIRRKVFEVGATDFITKPFKSTELVARAESHVSYRRDKDSLQKNVDIDLLTGALNPQGLQAQLERDVSFVNRHGANLAIIIFELDNFRKIYEKIGQQPANRIVKQVASVLLGAIRKEDSVGRIGLGKFVVILPMAKTEAVTALAKRLCAGIDSYRLSVAGEQIPVSMSAGICTARKGDSANAKALLESAEQALANAKAVGTGEVQILRPEPEQADEAPISVSIDALLEAIHQGQTEITQEQLEAVLLRFAPIVALMSEQQKQRLVKAPQKSGSAS